MRGAVLSTWESSRLRFLAAAVTGVVFVGGFFLLFRGLFGYLMALEDPEFGAALVQRLLSTALVAFSVFLCVSSIVTGVSTLFRSKETVFLLSQPVRAPVAGAFRTAESWFYAGWATILLGIPMLAAHALSWRVGSPALVPLALAGFALFVLSSVAAGSIVLFVLTSLGGVRRIWRALGAIVLLLVAGTVVVLASMSPSGVVIGDESIRSVDAVERFVANLPSTGGSLWPHQLLTSLLDSLAAGRTGRALGCLAILLLEALVLVALSLRLLSGGFRRRFARLGSDDPGTRTSSRLLGRGRGPLGTMMIKDLLVFLRDPVQYSQLALLAGLFLVYASNLHRFPFDVEDPLWRGVLVFLNISFSGFVMATILVRFAFPAVSLEKPGLHTVLTIPGGRRILYWSKWLPAFVLLFLLLELTGCLSAVSIGAGWVLLLETDIAIGLLSVVLVSINVGMGAVFPEFGDNNAARIASGHGGITSAFVSVGFVLLVVSSLSVVTRRYMIEGFREEILIRPLVVTFLLLVPVGLLAARAMNRAALRSIGRRDF